MDHLVYRRLRPDIGTTTGDFVLAIARSRAILTPPRIRREELAGHDPQPDGPNDRLALTPATPHPPGFLLGSRLTGRIRNRTSFEEPQGVALSMKISTTPLRSILLTAMA